jgi:hypothetical protein
MAERGQPKKRKRPVRTVLTTAAALTLALVAGIGILAASGPRVAFGDAIDSAACAKCQARLRNAYQGSVQFRSKDAARVVPAVDGLEGAYRRDLERFPLDGAFGAGAEPLAACDARAAEHQRDVVHVLYSDGTIAELALADLKADGKVPADTRELVVGPDSPVADLRKLARR